jgi:hypothetical protein
LALSLIFLLAPFHKGPDSVNKSKHIAWGHLLDIRHIGVETPIEQAGVKLLPHIKTSRIDAVATT